MRDFAVAVVEKALAAFQLAQHRIERRQQGFRREAGDGGGNLVAVDDEVPLFRPHHRGDVTGRDQCVEAGAAGIEQHRHCGPGQAAGQQHGEIVGQAFGQHRSGRRGGGLEAGGEEHHRALRIVQRDLSRIERAGDRPHVGAGGLRLGQRAHLALLHVDRHPQHVAEGDQNDLVLQRQLHRLIDVFFRADAHRAARAGHQFDPLRQGAAQAGVGDRAFVAAAHVHDLDRAVEVEGVDFLQPGAGVVHQAVTL